MQTVNVNGKKFRSLSMAAKYIGVACSRLSEVLKNRKELVYNDFQIKKVGKESKKKKKVGNAIRVLQVNTGKIFETIEEAAKFAEADGWTMSKKMAFSGGFVDKNGNEYKRLEPMRTKNFYSNDGMVVRKNYNGRKAKNLVKQEVPVKEVKKIKFEDYPVVVQGLIRREIRTMIREGKSWSEIKKFLREIGCEQLTIKVDVDE